MDFEVFKAMVQQQYDKFNSASLISFNVPSDEELLKLFISSKVMAEYEGKLFDERIGRKD